MTPLLNAMAMLDQMAPELAADPHGDRAQCRLANIRSQALEVIALAEQASDTLSGELGVLLPFRREGGR